MHAHAGGRQLLAHIPPPVQPSTAISASPPGQCSPSHPRSVLRVAGRISPQRTPTRRHPRIERDLLPMHVKPAYHRHRTSSSSRKTLTHTQRASELRGSRITMSSFLQRKLASLCSYPQWAISSAPPVGHGWCGRSEYLLDRPARVRGASSSSALLIALRPAPVILLGWRAGLVLSEDRHSRRRCGANTSASRSGLEKER